MLNDLVEFLQSNNLKISGEDLADAIWLARQMQDADATPDEGDAPENDDSHGENEDGHTENPFAPQTFTREVHLYSKPEERRERENVKGAMSVDAPVPTALSHPLELARAFRPFMRKVAHPALSTVNAEETVKRIAAADVWIPVMDHALTRWLDVALVVDRGASMCLWQQTADEFFHLLGQQGAFRDVRRWELDTNDAAKVTLYAGKGSQQARDVGELIEANGRRLILILTDCVSSAWYGKELAQALERWGERNIVTLVQVLPQTLWLRTALREATPAHLQAPEPGVPNTRFKYRTANPWDEDDTAGQHSIVIPVITIEPEPIAAWAQVIARASDRWIAGYKFVTRTGQPVDSHAQEREREENFNSFSPRRRLQLFLDTASPDACQLAMLLATVPISMPVVRLVQHTMLPDSQQVDVAEVFLSGLLKTTSEDSNPDYVQYDFIDGVRDDLLSKLPTNDKARVLGAVSQYLEENYHQVLDFRALIADPDAREDLFIGPESRPFALIAAHVFRRFGGKFIVLADWLVEQAGGNVAPVYDYGLVGAGTSSDTSSRRVEEEAEAVAAEAYAMATPIQDEAETVAAEAFAMIPSAMDVPQELEDEDEEDLQPFYDPRAVPQNEPIISRGKQPSPYVCPSCFKHIYIGDCRIISGTTGEVLKEAPRNPLRRQLARWNPERINPSDHRQCPICNYLLPYNAGFVPDITLAVIGDVYTGKSHYIASLLHQIENEWMSHAEKYATLTCLTPEVKQIYQKEYLDRLYKDKKMLPPNTPSSQTTSNPLIYELVMHHQLSDTQPSGIPPDIRSSAVNLLIYDASGEDFGNEEKLVSFSRFVFNQGGFIFAVDPVRIPPIFESLPLELQRSVEEMRIFAVGQKAAELLDTIISLYERYYGYKEGSSLPITPVAVMISKSDLLTYLDLPDSYTFMKNPQYRGSLDAGDINKVDEDVRELLLRYEQNGLLAATRRFKRKKFFATSATGEPPDENGKFKHVKPSRCLDPMLWILYEFGVINARK